MVAVKAHKRKIKLPNIQKELDINFKLSDNDILTVSSLFIKKAIFVKRWETRISETEEEERYGITPTKQDKWFIKRKEKVLVKRIEKIIGIRKIKYKEEGEFDPEHGDFYELTIVVKKPFNIIFKQLKKLVSLITEKDIIEINGDIDIKKQKRISGYIDDGEIYINDRLVWDIRIP